MGRQRLRGVVCGGRLEVRDERLGAVVRHGLPVGELRIGFTLTGLPRRRPEPRVVGIDRSLDDPAQQYSGTFEGPRGQRVDGSVAIEPAENGAPSPIRAAAALRPRQPRRPGCLRILRRHAS